MSSVMTALRFISGSITCCPQMPITLVTRVDRDGGVANMVSGRVVATTMNSWTAYHRVSNLVKLAGRFFVDNFQVRRR